MSSAPTVSVVRERLVYGFNTFYGDLLASIAKSDELLKKRLKRGYRVLDRKSDVYLTDWHKSAKEHGTLSKIFDEGAEEAPEVLELQIARGMRCGEVVSEIASIRLLSAIAWLFDELCDTAESEDETERDQGATAVNELFERLIESVSRIQTGLTWGSALEGMVDEEARAVFKATLAGLAQSSARDEGRTLADRLDERDLDSVSSAFEMMKCSKLGDIVKEISDSIDKDKLRSAVESGDMLSGNNMEMMGELFKKVSGAITSKIQSGELSNEDLVKETTSLMSTMKGFI